MNTPLNGENPVVAQGIYEHYRPCLPAMSCPRQWRVQWLAWPISWTASAAVSGLGLSLLVLDPYALRRQAYGVVKILLIRSNIRLPL